MYQYAPFPTIDMKRTGRRIEHLRKERGLSVRDLQAFFGFESPQAIYKWQWGDCLPSVDNLFALASVLQVPMQDLLVGTDQEVLHVSTQKNAGCRSIRPFYGAGTSLTKTPSSSHPAASACAC